MSTRRLRRRRPHSVRPRRPCATGRRAPGVLPPPGPHRPAGRRNTSFCQTDPLLPASGSDKAAFGGCGFRRPPLRNLWANLGVAACAEPSLPGGAHGASDRALRRRKCLKRASARTTSRARWRSVAATDTGQPLIDALSRQFDLTPTRSRCKPSRVERSGRAVASAHSRCGHAVPPLMRWMGSGVPSGPCGRSRPVFLWAG